MVATPSVKQRMALYAQLLTNNVERGSYTEDFTECAERVAEMLEYDLKSGSFRYRITNGIFTPTQREV